MRHSWVASGYTSSSSINSSTFHNSSSTIFDERFLFLCKPGSHTFSLVIFVFCKISLGFTRNVRRLTLALPVTPKLITNSILFYVKNFQIKIIFLLSLIEGYFANFHLASLTCQNNIVSSRKYLFSFGKYNFELFDSIFLISNFQWYKTILVYFSGQS